MQQVDRKDICRPTLDRVGDSCRAQTARRVTSARQRDGEMMFSYYGSKSKVIDLYPAPEYGKIIEPFAGSARYALKYWDRDVLLVDKYPVIVDLWKWLQKASADDILSLPSPKSGETINRSDYPCIEAAWLMGFMVQQGVNAPRLTVSSVGNFGKSIELDKRRIAESLHKIRHWKIVEGDYRDVSNQEATWFIDPPYQFGGEYYVKGNRDIDYSSLASWCESRMGQVMVCENTKATWMQFFPIGNMGGSQHTTTEAIWTNTITQSALFTLPLAATELA